MGFNVVGVSLGTFGFLNPIIAAIPRYTISVFVFVIAVYLYFNCIEIRPGFPILCLTENP